MNNFHFLPIKKITAETSEIKTFYFSHKLESKPGQFVMLWIPEVGQKPFSISGDSGEEFSLTVFKRGDVTNKLFSINVGESVGITGPLGTSFKIRSNSHYIMIAGGYGAAPLKFLAEKISQATNSTIDFCLGAKSEQDLIFVDALQKISNFHIATDDGSMGAKCFATDLLPGLVSNSCEQKNIIVVTCGPELMEKKVLDLCNKHSVSCEISIERYIKCGAGICGQCAVDGGGVCLCKEGPVVSKEMANKITEFGFYSRRSSGIKNFFGKSACV